MTFNAFDFTLRQMQYALAIEETGGFRRAAEACGVSQPSLSAQVAQLELALGVRLFERSRRAVLVTPEGATLLARFRRAVTAASDVAAAASGLLDPLSGVLRAGVIPTIAPYLLPGVGAALPDALRVEWREGKTEELVRDLEAGELDAALLALEADVGAAAVEPVARDPFVLAMAHHHPLASSRQRIEPHRLLELHVLLLDEGHCLREQALEVCAADRDETFRATSLATLVPMVARGEGVTLLPTIALAVENRDGWFHTRSFKSPAPGRTLGVIWRPDSPREPAARALADAARAAAPKHLRIGRA